MTLGGSMNPNHPVETYQDVAIRQRAKIIMLLEGIKAALIVIAILLVLPLVADLALLMSTLR